jgi:hypothetical protein
MNTDPASIPGASTSKAPERGLLHVGRRVSGCPSPLRGSLRSSIPGASTKMLSNSDMF